MFDRIRKAVYGAVVSGVATGVAFLAKAAIDGSVSVGDVSQAFGVAVAAALATLGTVYATRNGGGTNSVGSDPTTGTYAGR